ncbi:hypothetical protein QTI51_31870 [Variovorax sp. J22G73]|uniref:hypothetical protein n=1 Tax=unclassified Variovorax TaxID=663243 RepID=UPI0025769E91|nr:MULTISPECIES: hypothetical protein [unclassified Variovorax]MDM0009408.1 hypothetical protein [Variovorax sp. J22R203]MDM0101915.1 hypothetical protein [Variovorax sp. J22G73]
MIAEHRAPAREWSDCLAPRPPKRGPILAKPPSLATWAPSDFELEPSASTRQLLAGAQATGARVRQGTVEAIEVAGNRITGVVVEGQKLLADVGKFQELFEGHSEQSQS